MSSFIEVKLNYVYLSPYVCLGRSHALILYKTNERYKTLLECSSATGRAYFDAVLYLVWPWFISVCGPSRQRTPSNKNSGYLQWKFSLFEIKLSLFVKFTNYFEICIQAVSTMITVINLPIYLVCTVFHFSYVPILQCSNVPMLQCFNTPNIIFNA
jgi:hypothetical protein